MEKREKIILALTVVVVLYGAYDFLLAKPGANHSGGEPALPNSELLTTISTQMAASDNETNRQASGILARLQAPFPRDPFYPGDFAKDLSAANASQAAKEHAVVEVEPEIDFQAKDFIYSGFLQMGGEAIAIVNGSDHKLGDTINDFRLEKIEAEKIHLRKAKRTFEAFLQETKW